MHSIRALGLLFVVALLVGGWLGCDGAKIGAKRHKMPSVAKKNGPLPKPKNGPFVGNHKSDLSGNGGTLKVPAATHMPGAAGSQAIAYEYIDSGNRMRLERFGNVLVSRTCPSAVWKPGLPKSVWNEAKVNYDVETGWTGLEILPGNININSSAKANEDGGVDGDKNELAADEVNDRLESIWKAQIHQNLVLTLQPSEQGQIGIFPEQINNWNWIRFMLARAKMILSRSGTNKETKGIIGNGQYLAHVQQGKEKEQGAAHVDIEDIEDTDIDKDIDDSTGNLSVLNLFGYTGGSTLAALGVQVSWSKEESKI